MGKVGSAKRFEMESGEGRQNPNSIQQLAS